MEQKLNQLLEKVSNLESIMWEDRRFFVGMMIKLDKLIKIVNSFIFMDDVGEEHDTHRFEEEEAILSLLKRLSDIGEMEEEFKKYNSLITSEQFGES